MNEQDYIQIRVIAMILIIVKKKLKITDNYYLYQLNVSFF